LNIKSNLRSLTANITCVSPDTLSNTFRVHLTKKDKSTWYPVILVISRGDFNPLEYFSVAYNELTQFTLDFNLKIEECSIYVDLMEYVGVFQPFLFRWEISHVDNNNVIKNEIKDVDLTKVPEDHLDIIKCYYKDRWSAFNESCLTSEEKAQLIANILSNSIFDDFSAEQMQSDFKYRLLEALQNGKSEFWILLND
jgi:hypothetical protein